MNSFKTQKGTELRLIQLKGKDYLQVQDRLIWFREERPTWAIETELVQLSENHCIARAQVRDDMGRVMATAHKREDQKHFPDFMEKAETGSIGRALALVGFGTQFAAELEEGERIVDAPRASAKQQLNEHISAAKQAFQQKAVVNGGPAPMPPTPQMPEANESPRDSSSLGDYVVPFGKKYFGRRLSELSEEEIRGYMGWIQDDCRKTGKQISGKAAEFISAAKAYLDNMDGDLPF